MGFIIYGDVKYTTTIVRNSEEEKWEYTVEKFLHYMQSNEKALDGRTGKVKYVHSKPSTTTKMT